MPVQGRGASRENGPGPRGGASSAFLGARGVAPLLAATRLLAPTTRRRLGRFVRLRAATVDNESADAVAFDVTKEVGVCDPFGKPGKYVWDPLGLTTDMDETKFRAYRQAEIKHGRVSMLAIAGILNQHYWRFQGLDGLGGGQGVARLDDLPNGFRAVTEGAGPYLALLVLLAGIIELNASDEGREPGYFGEFLSYSSESSLGYLTSRDYDFYDTDWRNFELNHGRLAMFGIVGALAAEYVTGLDTFGQWEEVFRPR